MELQKIRYIGGCPISDETSIQNNPNPTVLVLPGTRWSAWKPKLTSCYEGFGLVDASGAFVPNRTLAVGCGLCQAGTASEELIDDEGRTFQCKQCPPGYSQSNTYSTQCEPCPKGTSASMFGSIACTPCDEGAYQPDTAQTSCIPCAASRTTLLLGASSLADCVCQAGKIEQLSICEDCSEESMHCPKGSTIAKLVAAPGTTDTRGPFVKKGFFSALHLLEQDLELLYIPEPSYTPNHLIMYI